MLDRFSEVVGTVGFLESCKSSREINDFTAALLSSCAAACPEPAFRRLRQMARHKRFAAGKTLPQGGFIPSEQDK